MLMRVKDIQWKNLKDPFQKSIAVNIYGQYEFSMGRAKPGHLLDGCFWIPHMIDHIDTKNEIKGFVSPEILQGNAEKFHIRIILTVKVWNSVVVKINKGINCNHFQVGKNRKDPSWATTYFQNPNPGNKLFVHPGLL